QKLVRDLRKDLDDPLIRIRSFKDSQENINEDFERAENFLSLTGLIILVLGGIGISSVTRVFFEQRRKTISVLKCVGAKGRAVTAAYLSQILTLGLAGSALGILLAKVGMLWIRAYYGSSLPPSIHYTLNSGAVAQGLGVGVMVTALFSALPLLRIRHI